MTAWRRGWRKPQLNGTALGLRTGLARKQTSAAGEGGQLSIRLYAMAVPTHRPKENDYYYGRATAPQMATLEPPGRLGDR
eukprot:155266-Prymnesium_polylepis.2